MPIHGEYRMLAEHTKLARDCGVNLNNSFVMDNGDVLAIGNKHVGVAGKFHQVLFMLMVVELEILVTSSYETVESFLKKV